MTGAELEVRQETAPAVTAADTDSWVSVMRPILALAEQIADTEFVPRGLRGSMPATAAAMLYGREVGLPPMTALNMTHVVEGKPGLSAEGMRALVLAAGHRIEVTETNGGTCTMRGRRRDSETWTSVTWTLDMARAAGLTGKSNWKNYPRQLLQARCTTELCRLVFPDVIHGFRSVEELEDMSDEDAAVTPGAFAPSAGGTTRVGRTRKATTPRKQAAALPAPAREDVPSGPPLPGEAGYEETPGGSVMLPGGTGEEATSEGEAGGTSSPTPDTAESDAPSPVAPLSVVPTSSAPDTEESGEEATPEQGPASSPVPITRAQHRALMARLSALGVDPNDREDRLDVVSTLIGRRVDSSNAVTKGEASQLIDTLARCETAENLAALVDSIKEGEES